MSKFYLATICMLFFNFLVYSQQMKNINLGRFNLLAPTELKALNQEEREITYAVQMPDAVYQNENNDINISYKSTSIPIQESQLLILKNHLEKQYSNPSSEIIKNDMIKLDDKKFVIIQVLLETDKILLTNLVTSLKGRMVMLIISYSLDRAECQVVSDIIVKSLRIE